MKTKTQLIGSMVLLVGAVSSFGQPTNPAPSIRAHYISLMVIAGIIAILQFWFRWSRGAAILERWARSDDFRLLESKRPWIIWKGPFAWAAKSGPQIVYRIKVRDSRGEVLTGWARAGGPFLGLLRSQVDVKWDSIRRPAPTTMRDLADMQKGAIPIVVPRSMKFASVLSASFAGIPYQPGRSFVQTVIGRSQVDDPSSAPHPRMGDHAECKVLWPFRDRLLAFFRPANQSRV